MLGKSTAFSENQMFDCRGKLLDLREPKIMGILNLTQDSFYDGGRNLKDNHFIAKAEQLIQEGASIIDIGAASTKPGSLLIDVEEEWGILDKPMQTLRRQFPNHIFSIDTYHSETANRAADNGADMINDISGGTIDNDMFSVVAKHKLAYVLMHIQGTPETMQQDPIAKGVLPIVKSFFERQLEQIDNFGIESVMLDPGFGFGKNIDENYRLLKELKQFKDFNRPVLAGLSRKSMIYKHLDINPQEALNGTSVLNTFALLNGANVLRVHDVKEAHETIRLFMMYKQF